MWGLRSDKSELYGGGLTRPYTLPPGLAKAIISSIRGRASGGTEPPVGDLRPLPGTYANQYRYEDLTGADLRAKLNYASTLAPLTTRVVVTFPAGTFSFSDFTVNYSYTASTGYQFGYGVRIPVNVSLIGSGREGTYETRFQMTAESSTKANEVPVPGWGQTNNLSLMGLQNTTVGDTTYYPPSAILANFSLIGTHQPIGFGWWWVDPATNVGQWVHANQSGAVWKQHDNPDGQGHRYNGLRVQGATNPTIQNIYIEGCAGNQAAPPGETFGLNIYNGGSAKLIDVEVDGRRTRQGGTVSISSSPIGFNGHSNATCLRVNAHDCKYGMPTHWLSDNTVWTDSISDGNKTGWNHERTRKATHIRPTVKVRNLNPHHWTMMNDTFDGQLIIQAPTWDKSSAVSDGRMVVQMGPRSAAAGFPDLQVSPPVVTNAAGQSIMSQVLVAGN